MTNQPDFAPALEAAVSRAIEGVTSIAGLTRLSGGASQETWSFDGVGAAGATPLILRRAPGGKRAERSSVAPTLETEAKAIRLAAKAGVPVPPVPYVLEERDQLGPGYLMGRLEGETIARKILRDPEFAQARPKLARQCGNILARNPRDRSGADSRTQADRRAHRDRTVSRALRFLRLPSSGVRDRFQMARRSFA